jgi:hypothetical protein
MGGISDMTIMALACILVAQMRYLSVNRRTIWKPGYLFVLAGMVVAWVTTLGAQVGIQVGLLLPSFQGAAPLWIEQTSSCLAGAIISLYLLDWLGEPSRY